MIRLAHYAHHLPVDAGPVLRALSGPQEDWLGARQIDDRSWALPLTPAGLVGDPTAELAVLLGIGPMRLHDEEVVRRLSFGVDGLVPETRCDLTARAVAGHGVRLRLQGEFRGATAAGPDPLLDAVEAIMQPLVHRIAGRTAPLRCGS